MASYGAEYQHESTSFSLALLLATQRLKVIAAVHPGLWQPGVLAKLAATADHLSNGRVAVNVVSGWFKGEFTALGEPWLEHDERYRRSEEFIRALRGVWTEDRFNLARRLLSHQRLQPEAQAGADAAPRDLPGRKLARRAARWPARVSDWYFMNGNSLEGVRAQVDEMRAIAAEHPRARRAHRPFRR